MAKMFATQSAMEVCTDAIQLMGGKGYMKEDCVETVSYTHLDVYKRQGLRCVDFLNPECITIPARDATAILEVKWDAFLPDVIRDAVQIPRRRAEAFSKYAVCRMYD